MKIKHKWIFDYIMQEPTKSVNTLNCKFSDLYVEHFKTKILFRMWGSDVVPDLAKNLKEMYDLGILDRKPMGICPTISGMPKWIYVYFLKEKKI